MKPSHSGWVLLNYPVVTSRSRDNAGGFDHLVGNLQVYRHLGFKVLCICRWSPRLVDRLEGALMLNIVPGAAVPAASVPAAGNTTGCQHPPRWRAAALALRTGALALLGTALQWLLRPRLLHQRANLRFTLSPRGRHAVHLVELNDEFVPASNCDAYLTVARRPALELPQFVWRWPVPEVARFDSHRFLQRLATLSQPPRRLQVLLFGIGGTTAPKTIREFIATHPWFRSNAFDLHIFGGNAHMPAMHGVVQHGWCDARQLPAQDFDAAVLFYDEQVYDDERLRLGSPTKLWKYIDWSLPVFCNRPHISRQFLGQFDSSAQVLHDDGRARQFAEHLQALRRQTLPDIYAQELAAFLGGLGDREARPVAWAAPTARTRPERQP